MSLNKIKLETKELRRKLINDFGKFIDDDSKLEILESVFDAIEQDEKDSIVPDVHYNLVAEEREKYLSGEIQASSWEEAEQRLNAKYGF